MKPYQAKSKDVVGTTTVIPMDDNGDGECDNADNDKTHVNERMHTKEIYPDFSRATYLRTALET